MRVGYVGVQVLGPISESYVNSCLKHLRVVCLLAPSGIPFTLSEVRLNGEPRLFFTRGDIGDAQAKGNITIPGPNMIAEQVVTVYAVVSADYVLCSMCLATTLFFIYRVILRRQDHTSCS